ncbi:glycoside hydrolase domain-containing protein [Metabacillus malikii]|uniref:Rv2525c-like glycoside hydrolase-like domain-containing protein n=1 Tax=Metabacillus malikii TaxID=1504265 RepID=A0ABT9ZKH9_9BACI|nr:glycoside hydrolase domain-containing protein [Metabacillus malikii]MDQ0232485.1 hypothetical protein [Metabacillus malikii]
MTEWYRHLWKIIGFSLFLILPLLLCFYIIHKDRNETPHIDNARPVITEKTSEENDEHKMPEEQDESVETASQPTEEKNKDNEANNDEQNNATANNKDNRDKNNDATKEETKPEVPDFVWGVDSASYTDDTLLACVNDNFGNPKVWGRYLGDKEGVSKGITKEEWQLLNKNGIKVLLISNQFTDATTYEKGKAEAEQAIKLAKEVGSPEKSAIFADIEPDYPVDENFIVGWYETISSSGYIPGIYGIFDQEEKLTIAFNAASEQKEGLKESTYLWTAAPNIGITSESNAPKYSPEGPEGSMLYGWQYGIDAETCNIDTNLFKGELLNHLW